MAVAMWPWFNFSGVMFSVTGIDSTIKREDGAGCLEGMFAVSYSTFSLIGQLVH